MVGGEKTGARPGLIWIVWCAAMFFVVLGLGSRLWTSYVVVPDCESECAAHGARFEQLRIGTRSGPPTACMCAGTPPIETSVPDLGMFLLAILFLVTCWAPFAIAARAPQTPRGDP